MKAAYVDTSCLVAVAFGEPGGNEVRNHFREFDVLLSANLLEAELQSAFAREDVPPGDTMLQGLVWVLPDRPLSEEIARVLRAGYLRGADVWHLAAALYLAGTPEELAFMTLDARQRQVASALGFPTPLPAAGQ
jgi:predicted nucleic acid-binding protein